MSTTSSFPPESPTDSRPGASPEPSGRSPDRRFMVLHALAAPAIFAVLTFLYFSPLLLDDKTFSGIAGHQSIQYPWAAAPTGFADIPQSDQANNGYPIQADLNRELRDGTFPYWSPYSFAGGPTLGTFYGLGFYPPRLAASLVVPPIWVHDLLVVFHVWLAGTALFLLLRRLGASWAASLLGGVAWMFCPAWFALALLEGGAILAALLPLALWLIHRAVTLRSLADAAACGAVLALLVLGASVQPAVFAFLIVCLWGFAVGVRAAPPDTPRRTAAVRSAILVGVAGALGVALCAFVVLPTTAQISDSGRAEVPYAELLTQDVGLDDFSHLLDPQVPRPLTGDTVWTLTFIGIPAGLLALAGLFSRRAGAGLGRSLALVFFLLVAGTPLTRVAYELLPGFAYLSPMGRLLPFASLGIVLLAAIGLDVVRDRVVQLAPDGRKARATAVVSGVAVALVAVEAWQVMSFSRDTNPPFQPREAAYLYPRTPLLTELGEPSPERRRSGDVQRIVPVRRGAPEDPYSPPPLVGETPRLFELETVGGYMNVMPRRSRINSLVLSGVPPDQARANLVGAYVSFYFAASTRFDLLERLGVNELVAPPDALTDAALRRGIRALDAEQEYAGADGMLFRIPRAAPRAFVVGDVETAPDEAAALDRFLDPSFRFRRTVLLDGDDAPRQPSGSSGGPVDARVRVLPGDPSERNIEVDSPHAGWLVVLDSWDKGWTARVSGRETPVHRADFAFRAVQIPAGRSVVEMDYRTPWLRPAIVISILGLVGALACCLWQVRRYSRRRG